jgi:dihydroxy-acid dehydratase
MTPTRRSGSNDRASDARDIVRRALRSNLPRGSYLWAVRNAQWRALGIPEEDLEKPKIAVVNSSSELASCFSHLDQVADIVKKAIRAVGALAFEVRTTAPSDFITGVGARGAYILAARDLVTNDIEVMVEGAQLDGMVCLASCDKTVPGQLMAAARMNVPTLMLACGYQPSGEYNGKHVDIEDVFVGAMHAATGALPLEEVVGMSRNAVRGPGVCTGLGTANSMHMVCEALGMALPGSTPVAAMSARMFDFARQVGARIVQMVWDDLKPRDILTRGAFRNAVSTVLAVGGSINCVKHLQAVSVEGECGVDVYALFEQLASEVPVLSAVRPTGPRSIEEFEGAGGCRALLKQLEPMLEKDAMTATGDTLEANLRDVTVAEAEIIRPLDRPIARTPAIVLVRGSLCPEGGIVKFGIDPDKKRTFSGRAICFDSSDAALEALRRGEIESGHVVVMRGSGACGGPAMGGGASRVVFALDGAGLGAEVALLTDGHLSGLVCKGLVVAEVSPEAAVGGPLALVADGDRIAIDLHRRTCELAVEERELDARRQRWKPPKPLHDRGWLGIYRRNVTSMAKGGVLTGDK